MQKYKLKNDSSGPSKTNKHPAITTAASSKSLAKTNANLHHKSTSSLIIAPEANNLNGKSIPIKKKSKKP